MIRPLTDDQDILFEIIPVTQPTSPETEDFVDDTEVEGVIIEIDYDKWYPDAQEQCVSYVYMMTIYEVEYIPYTVSYSYQRLSGVNVSVDWNSDGSCDVHVDYVYETVEVTMTFQIPRYITRQQPVVGNTCWNNPSSGVLYKPRVDPSVSINTNVVETHKYFDFSTPSPYKRGGGGSDSATVKRSQILLWNSGGGVKYDLVKMLHNDVHWSLSSPNEYTFPQAGSEWSVPPGYKLLLLRDGRYMYCPASTNVDMSRVLKVYNSGSVIRFE